jgi:hypothetical protein
MSGSQLMPEWRAVWWVRDDIVVVSGVSKMLSQNIRQSHWRGSLGKFRSSIVRLHRLGQMQTSYVNV